MAGVTLHMVPHTKELQAKLRQMYEAGADPSRFLRPVGEYLRKQVDAAFRESGRGRPWPPLKPRTLAYKQRKGWSSKPLIRRGSAGLQGGFGIKMFRDHVDVGTAIEYASYLQSGWKHRGPSPMVEWIEEKDEPAVLKLADAFMVRVVRGGH